MPFKYFGDDYLEFHDFINSLDLIDYIEADINMHTGFINPIELAYYTGGKKNLMHILKFVKEIRDEKDISKHEAILIKYGMQQKDIPISHDVKSIYN